MSNYHFVCKPCSPLQKIIHVPGDKSLTHRALILGAIATGRTLIYGYLAAKDCLATLNALQKLGVNIQIKATHIEIDGVGLYGLTKSLTPLDCENSGTSMRLLTGLLCGQSFDSELIGDASLSARPMGRIIKPLSAMGAKIESNGELAPLNIFGKKQKGTLKGLNYVLPIASAQLKSALLLAGLYSKESVILYEQDSTRDHLERMLKTFGYPLDISPYDFGGQPKVYGHRLCIKGGGHLYGTSLYIPSDISSAAFFIVAATLISGSELCIENVGVNPTRTGLIDILIQMGANIRLSRYQEISGEPIANLYIKSAKLKGVEVKPNLVPRAIDEFPVLFLAAAMAKGTTVLKGLSELRYKESDRIAVMSTALQKLGVQIEVDEDTVIIHGRDGAPLIGAEVDTKDDHRIAMALSIAGAVCDSQITVLNVKSIDTSFPNFYERAIELGLNIHKIKDCQSQESIHAPLLLTKSTVEEN